jgi:hypothetical protein
MEQARGGSWYGWTGQEPCSGFSDIERPTLGRIHFLDRFWALQLMAHSPLLWLKSKSKYFRFYEVASN